MIRVGISNYLYFSLMGRAMDVITLMRLPERILEWPLQSDAPL